MIRRNETAIHQNSESIVGPEWRKHPVTAAVLGDRKCQGWRHLEKVPFGRHMPICIGGCVDAWPRRWSGSRSRPGGRPPPAPPPPIGARDQVQFPNASFKLPNPEPDEDSYAEARENGEDDTGAKRPRTCVVVNILERSGRWSDANLAAKAARVRRHGHGI